MTDTNKAAMLKIKRWREDPVTFVTECFGVTPDEWQVDVLRAFPAERRIAMKACKGPGKSCVMAWLAWNFLATRPSPKIIATSISGDNLQDGLWTEMAKWQAKSQFLTAAFEWKKESITPRQKLPEHNDWIMVARQWSKSADSSQQSLTLAGKHADYMLFILDEVGGIPDAVMASAEAALASGVECKILMAGNPTHLEGPLYRACTTERNLWHVTEITSDPDDPKRTPRVSVEWAREQIEKYGRDSAYVLVNVFGKFPPSSLNSLIGPDEVNAAMRRHLSEDKYSFVQRRLGVDVARFGGDRTVIFQRQGLAAFKPIEMRDARTNEIGDRVISLKNQWQSDQEFIDDTGGYGGGVVDYMMLNGYNPVPVNFSSRPTDSRYFNKRAEIWFRMVEWIKKGGCLPNIPELVKELCTPTYTFQNGKLQLESKDQIKDRLGSSPDFADALALTFTQPDSPRRHNELEDRLRGYEQGKLQYDFDPFDTKHL